jgi:glutathionylspermidine synthase
VRRRPADPRPNWQSTVESQGLHYHTPNGHTYWDERVYYEFTAGEIDQLEQATYALNEMCLRAVEDVITNRRYGLFMIPEYYEEYLARSWATDDRTVYGRFDLSFDGRSPPKLLEINADTPTTLIESALVQWHWLKDAFPDADQFNSVHERLIEAWRAVRAAGRPRVHFAALRDSLEDYLTVNYLRDTAVQAGVEGVYINMRDIGWDPGRRVFVDARNAPIESAFKLYPWSWMVREQFGRQLPLARTRWLEPPWKMIPTHKAFLAVLWEMFPESPYLLPTGFDEPPGDYIRKPLQAPEGTGITLRMHGEVIEQTDGRPSGPAVYQAVERLPEFNGYYPLVGSWLVNGYAAGIGVREDESPIATDGSRFVPHLFV